MIVRRDKPLAFDHLESPLPGSRSNLADLSRTICSCCKNFSFSFLDIGNSYTFFFSVGVDSGSPYQLLYSWICLAAVRWGWGWADGGKLEALYNKPTTDLHPHVFLSDSQPSSGKIANLENQFWQLFCHFKKVW